MTAVRVRRAVTAGWVAVVGGLAVVTSLGVVPAPWPFVDWPMFAGRGQRTTDRTLAVVRTADGRSVPLLAEWLPGGYRDDAVQARWPRMGTTARTAMCRDILADLRAGASDVELPAALPDPRAAAAVNLQTWRWRLLDRAGDRPADVARTTEVTCT